MIGEFLAATFKYMMRWKIFQWMKFLFRHSSNSKKLSRQKFDNELACLYTQVKMQTENQQQLTDGGILANRNSANHPYCFLSNQKKVQILAFLLWSVKEMYHVLLPKAVYRDKGRGHDRRLTAKWLGTYSSVSLSLPRHLIVSGENIMMHQRSSGVKG